MESYKGRGGTITYTLEKKLSSGGEGTVYTIMGKPNSVAKIYKDERLSSVMVRNDMHNKILAMIDMRFSPIYDGKLIVAWPEDILVDASGKFQGYVMPKVVGKKSIIWAKRESDRNILFDNQYRWRKSVAIAYNLSMVVEILHNAGIVIGDMNPNNILIDKSGIVTLIDADSFNITTSGKTYKGTMGMDEVLPPELQGKDLSEPQNRFSKETDRFALAIHVFDLLCNNCHPFGCLNFNSNKGSTSKSARITNIVTGYCPYVTGATGAKSETAPDMDMLPATIRTLFDRVFKYTAQTAVRSETIQARPTAYEWRIALGNLYNSSMKICSVNSLHEYPAHYTKSCPWCEINRKGQQPVKLQTTTNTTTATVQTQQRTHTQKTLLTPPKKKKRWKGWLFVAAVLFLIYFSYSLGITLPSELQQVRTGNNTVYVNASSTTRVKFVAPSSGTYVFTTVGNDDTFGYLYENAISVTSLCGDNDGGTNNNFSLSRALGANETIYVGVKYYNQSNSGNITLNISRRTNTVSSTSARQYSPTNTPRPELQQVRTGNNTVYVNANSITRVKFVAPSSGRYIFTSVGNQDTYGYLYSRSTSTSALDDDDDNGTDNNFYLTRSLSANETIYVGVKFFSSSSSGFVTVNISRESNSSSGTTNKTSWPVGEYCTIYVGQGNARSDADDKSTKLQTVFKGERYEILDCKLGTTGKDWYKIRVNNQLCWVSSGLVELNGNTQGTINRIPIN